MKIDYIEIILLWGWWRYLDEYLVVELEEKYNNYKKDWEWKLLEDEFIRYFNALSINETIEFISKLKAKICSIIKDSKVHNEVIIKVIFSSLYSASIADSFEKYRCNYALKEFLFSILDELESWLLINDYLKEKIIYYKHNIYRLFKWLSNEKYFELFEEKFKNEKNYNWLYNWHWEFLD